MEFTYRSSIGTVDIMIDETYIMISKVPLDVVNGADDVTFNRFIEHDIVTGYDRVDGINYYKSFPNKDVVAFITEMIATYAIGSGVDEEPEDHMATMNMERFRELFLIEASKFAETNDHFDAYEALEQVLDDDDICNDIHSASPEELPDVVEYALDHYVW